MSETDFTSTGLEDPESPCQDRVSLEPGPKSTGHSADRKDFSLQLHPGHPTQSPPRPLKDQVNATPFTWPRTAQSHHPLNYPLDIAKTEQPRKQKLEQNPKTSQQTPYPLTTTMSPPPTISLLPPTPSISKTYSPTLRSCIQQTSPPSSSLPPTPQTFLDAMTVREAVFVDEQKVALENEFDEEDPRCWHWVLYASEEHGTEPKPAGTIRLVPFPQLGEEPRAGGVYFGGELTNAEELGGEFSFSVLLRDVGT